MISVMTITYRRRHLLEEAIESYLRQDFLDQTEMLIVNDCFEEKYLFDHPNIKIINCDNRFPSIGEKLEFGFSQCKYDYIYRLDDDDLLAPFALMHTMEDIENNPGYDIYRSNGHYYFENNRFLKISSSVNNGNVYTKHYLSRIKIPNISFGEDYEITFNFNAKIYESPRDQKTLIYRWGMNTYHVSGMGNISSQTLHKRINRIVRPKSKGTIQADERTYSLHPQFKEDYYKQLIRI